MIVPSIDLMNGNAVQLVGGREMAIDGGDPRPIAKRFRYAGEMAVIDLDAALGQGSNEEIIKELIEIGPCRVGGGIRDVDTARKWLNAGASKIILGTAAHPDLLKHLPRDRVIVALDALNDEVQVEGWRKGTGCTIEERIKELRPFVDEFLITIIEREGRLEGIDLGRALALKEMTDGASLTIAGGVTTTDEIAQLDAMGIDAQVGMALYANRMDLAEAIAAPLKSDRPDGLWPTVVVDERGVALGLAYSDLQSLKTAIELKRGVYRSRQRGIWIKGETSGDTQELLGIDLDCDRDTLRFTVRQRGSGFCHKSTRTCWGEDRGSGRLARRLASRLGEAPEESFTRRLFSDPDLLRVKLLEEAQELAEAQSRDEVIWETADMLYFTLVAMAKGGVDLSEVEAHLDRRALQVTRRSQGDAIKTTGAQSP